MDKIRGQFLACSRFPGDEHRAVPTGHLQQIIAQVADLAADADQCRLPALIRCFVRGRNLKGGCRIMQMVLDAAGQFFGGVRAGEIILGPGTQGGNGLFFGAVLGNQEYARLPAV